MSDTKYVWSGWTLVAELSSDGSTVRRSFVYGRDFTDAQGSAGGAGALLAQIDNGTVSYAMPDALGNIAGYVSSTGAMAAAVEYSPYGRPISTTSTSSNFPVGYAGQYTDWETGLVYYGYRYYMPKHGRFINRDPSEEQGGYNLYAFCLNGPTGSWDTLGLWDQSGNPSNAAEGFQLWVQRGGAILNGASPATPNPTATDDFIQAWHGLQTTLSTPDAVIRGYTITQDYTAGTVTHTDDFGHSVTVLTPPKASDSKAPKGSVTLGDLRCEGDPKYESSLKKAPNNTGDGGINGFAVADVTNSTVGLVGDLSTKTAQELQAAGKFAMNGNVYKAGFYGNQYAGYTAAEVAAAKSGQAALATAGKLVTVGGTVVGVGLAGVDVYRGGASNQSLARGAVGVIGTATAFIPVAGPFIALGISVTNAAGGFDWIYSNFDNTPRFGRQYGGAGGTW